MKKLLRIHHSNDTHWVGDGFPVRTIFSYNSFSTEISPFLLLDYAGPAKFTPAEKSRGVGSHPHRGFETVTIVYQGEVEHWDNAGNKGKIGQGDVQWMTAAKGVLHSEMHGKNFSEHGGVLEMVQLWVNLPAKDKMSDAHYQTILNNQIPEVKLDKSEGFIRVIAGDYQGKKGPAKTFTPINLWDLRLLTGSTIELNLPEGFTTMLFILKGKALLNNIDVVGNYDLAFFELSGKSITITAQEDTTILVMNGEPIKEPVIGYGPFVMNTKEEIRQAMIDFDEGHF